MSAPGCMVDGDPGAKLLVIAMAPGREEIAHDKPLIGPTGQELWRTLSKKAGVDRADCYMVNTIGEWPEGIDGNPTKVQLDKYWDQFDEAVLRSRASVAVVLGTAALQRTTGLEGGVEGWRGYLVAPHESRALTRTITRNAIYKTSRRCKCSGKLTSEAGDLVTVNPGCGICGGTGWAIRKGDPKIEKAKAVVPAPWPPYCQWIIPTYHPSAILRSGYTLKPAFAADIMRVGRALRGELKVFDPSWSESVQRSYAVPYPTPCVFDIETGGIDHGTITRIGSSLGDVWTSLWDVQSRDALRGQLLDGEPSTAFNIGFDAPRLEAAGCPVPEPWWDVMLAAATVKPELKKSLNYVASLYMDTPRWKHLSEAQPAKYNAWDVAATQELYYILRAELERTGQLELFEKRMMPTVPVLVDMTRRGIKVDTETRINWLKELSAKRNEIFTRWEQLAPGQKTSGSGLLKWLHYTAGIPVTYSKHGGQSSEAAGLKKLLLTHTLTTTQRAILETLLELRGVEKELKTYAEVDLAGDGCVHPGFLPAGKDDDAFGKGIAGTGRITSSRPNIQNQPGTARRMFIPHSSEDVLLEADWSQIEARILAELADDDELRAAIAEGLHTSNMRVLAVDKTRAKNGFYGWAYGAGKRTLHNTFISRGFYVPEAECEALLRGFDRRFARTAALRRRIAHEVSHNYYLTNAFGRRRYFLGGSRDVPAGLDFQPQSCAADIMWTVLRPLADRLRGAGSRVLATVHDSVLIECPRGALNESATIMKQVMEQPWPELGGLSVPVELKTGENWGAMEPCTF